MPLFHKWLCKYSKQFNQCTMNRKSFLKFLGVGVAAAVVPAPFMGAVSSPIPAAPIPEPVSIAPELDALPEANMSIQDLLRKLVVLDKDGKPCLRVKNPEK